MTRELVLASLLCLSSIAGATTFEDTVHRVVPAPDGARLILDAQFGDIEVLTGGSKQIQIDVYRRVDTRDRADADAIFQDFDLSVQTKETEIVVKGIFKNGWERGMWGDFCHNGKCLSYSRKLKKHHYRIQIPSRFSVDLSTWAGDIQIGDLEGDVSAFTSGGDIRLGNVRGSVQVDTSGGDIQIGETAADVEASTSGGDIEIRQAQNVMAETSGGDIEIVSARGIVKADTSGGDVKVRLMEQPKGDCHVETAGGDVVVYLPATIKMNVDAETDTGEVDVGNFTITDALRDEDSLRGQINGGGPDLILRTSAGDIEIRALP